MRRDDLIISLLFIGFWLAGAIAGGLVVYGRMR